MSLVLLTIGIGLVSVEVSNNSATQKAAVDHIGTFQETAAVTNTHPDVIFGHIDGLRSVRTGWSVL